MLTKTYYFGTKRSIAFARSKRSSFRQGDNIFETLGDKIVKAQMYGADLGNTVPVTFDDPNDEVQGVDVISSPNHDFFDIAEQFGEMIDSAGPVPGVNETE